MRFITLAWRHGWIEACGVLTAMCGCGSIVTVFFACSALISSSAFRGSSAFRRSS